MRTVCSRTPTPPSPPRGRLKRPTPATRRPFAFDLGEGVTVAAGEPRILARVIRADRARP